MYFLRAGVTDVPYIYILYIYIYIYIYGSDGRYQNFPLSIIARLIATIIAIPTAKYRNQKKEVSVLLQYTVS